MHFDPCNPILVPLAEIEPRIQTGWIAQYRGKGAIAWMIQRGTGGCHSHSAMFVRRNGHVDVCELREFIGGRATPLNSQAERFPGQIDVFSVDTQRWPEWQPKGAAEVIRHLTGRDYGWWGVSRLFLLRCPVARWVLKTEVNDSDIEDYRTIRAPFCSHAVATACRLGGGVDPVPNCRDDYVTPHDLTKSMLFRYEGTIA